MNNSKKNVGKLVANAAYQTAVKNANSVCNFFFHQPKLPDQVRKLRKF